ncbi:MULTISPECIES: FabA/FabZ family ACP-dehydratase [Arenibacter]|uniref:3-hydroxyacyl-ACP dehydratase FabZ family protein n=1 Tax=Arenibacter TaxID=178469 RepID=UPI001C065985|nr:MULTISPECIES: FabA/FabZ family ACP-dehydratase [Arenibacter]MBU2905460.1 hydroxymyristoyl-ACP dehydratase [Arenibacter algicola]MCK0135197.1 hydroxymyristoyl-ACP dehydratase [Arenibacter sp. S6351L]
MLIINDIIKKLPYTNPFLFVDRINMVSANALEGCYTFKQDEFFYKGHFKEQPVTPGVILTECCAQIGLVCLGIHLLNLEELNTGDLQVALSSSEMQFLLPVFPQETVTVKSSKLFFRFNKLKCEVKMYNQRAQLVCKGVLSGMIKNNNI